MTGQAASLPFEIEGHVLLPIQVNDGPTLQFAPRHGAQIIALIGGRLDLRKEVRMELGEILGRSRVVEQLGEFACGPYIRQPNPDINPIRQLPCQTGVASFISLYRKRLALSSGEALPLGSPAIQH